MNYLKRFLESSTIHGLVYISQARNFARLFWILVVMTGFSVAGFMISQSFENWRDSPIKTTIETKPIKDITFPKVTVCPPKNTFTNLNYDLMMLANLTLNNETRDELARFASMKLHDSFYHDVLVNMSKLEEDQRYLNWYLGHSRIKLPSYVHVIVEGLYTNEKYLKYYLEISALTGSFQTQYFGEEFDERKLERNLTFQVQIIVPENLKGLKNLTMDVEIEKVELNTTSDGEDRIRVDTEDIIEGRIVLYSITNPQPFRIFDFISERTIYDDDLWLNRDLQTMPGFKVRWSYNQPINIRKPRYMYYERTREFRKFANLIHNNIEHLDKVWNIIHKIRFDIVSALSLVDYNDECNYENWNFEPMLEGSSIKTNNQRLAKGLGIKLNDKVVSEISAETLKTAGEMFIYLNLCSNKVERMLQFLEEIFLSQTPDMILLTLNRMRLSAELKSLQFGEVLHDLLREMIVILNLEYKNLEQVTSGSGKVYTKISDDLLKSKILQRITNHPVHILDEKGEASPSAFLPFCGFGSTMVDGSKNNQFRFPICSGFKSKLVDEQICYEIDPNLMTSEKKKIKDFTTGLFLIIDENEDRQLSFSYRDLHVGHDHNSFNELMTTDKFDRSTIMINTIGKFSITFQILIINHVYLCNIQMFRFTKTLH